MDARPGTSDAPMTQAQSMSRPGVPLLYLLPSPESYTSVPRRLPGRACVTLPPKLRWRERSYARGDQLLFFSPPVSATPVTKLPPAFSLCVPRLKLLCHRLVILGEAHSALVRILHQTFASPSSPLPLLAFPSHPQHPNLPHRKPISHSHPYIATKPTIFHRPDSSRTLFLFPRLSASSNPAQCGAEALSSYVIHDGRRTR